MSRLRWPARRIVVDPYAPTASADNDRLRAENATLRGLLDDRRKELLSARTSLAFERRQVRELTDQLRAGRLMLDAALKACAAAKCPHGAVVTELRTQLAVMQERQSVLQAANERRDVREYATGFTPTKWSGSVR